MGLASPAEIFDLPVVQQSLRGAVITPLCLLNNNDVGRDGNDDGMEFSKPRTSQSNQTLSAPVDDGVGILGSLTPPITSYHKRTAEVPKIFTRLLISYR